MPQRESYFRGLRYDAMSLECDVLFRGCWLYSWLFWCIRSLVVSSLGNFVIRDGGTVCSRVWSVLGGLWRGRGEFWFCFVVSGPCLPCPGVFLLYEFFVILSVFWMNLTWYCFAFVWSWMLVWYWGLSPVSLWLRSASFFRSVVWKVGYVGEVWYYYWYRRVSLTQTS
jgi:hypothetical protein